MNEIIQTIINRRSIRKYESKDVSDDQLKQIFESVRCSPSWANTQCWHIIVVRNRSTKEKLQATLTEKNPAIPSIVQAPVVLALCGKQKVSGFYKDIALTKYGDWFMFDLGLATQSICLTAHSLGLGTVIVGAFDHDKASSILNIKSDLELTVLIPLGYPAHASASPPRKKIMEFVQNE